MIWHYERAFDLIVETRKKIILTPVGLPAVPARSPLYKHYQAFGKSHHAATPPDHGRIEKSKLRVRYADRRGNFCLTMALRDEDYAYALQRLVHLVHETFLIFLVDGPYRDYMTEQLGADVEIG